MVDNLCYMHLTSGFWLGTSLVALPIPNESKRVLIASRFLAGFGASAILALAGGVLGDIWEPEERGKSIGWYLAFPLIAVASRPILGGIITAHTSWRWTF